MYSEHASPGYLLPVPGEELATVSHCYRVNNAQQLLDCSVLCKQLFRLHILQGVQLRLSQVPEQALSSAALDFLQMSLSAMTYLLVGSRQICVAGPGVQHDASHILFASSKL